MTNATPPTSGGGMPKWLIILLVILLVMILGCCGGVTTCFFLARRAARSAIPALQQAQQRVIDAEQKALQEQAARNGTAPVMDGTPATPMATPAAPVDGGTGGTNATPSAAPSGVVSMSKLPKNFPTDVPVVSGLTPSMSSSDNVANKGMVMLSGKVKTDDVVTSYTQGLEKAGYTQASNTNTNDITQLVYTKDALQVFVQVTPGDSGAATSSNVTIIYGPK